MDDLLTLFELTGIENLRFIRTARKFVSEFYKCVQKFKFKKEILNLEQKQRL